MKKFMRRFASGVKGLAKKVNGKALAIMGAALAFSNFAMAQTGSGAFNAGIGQAAQDVRATFATVSTLMLAIGGVVGLVGAVRIYIKWNNGDQDVTKSIIAWAGAALFLVVSGTILSLIFA